MDIYTYEGPVMEYERCVQHFWKAETTASSEAKARSNLSYRWKKENGRVPRVKVTLPGKFRKESV